jgi:trk system potassium uptake protein TrkH
MDINRWRERINLKIYNSKLSVLRSFKLASLVVSIFAVGVLTYYYGFEHTARKEYLILGAIRVSFLFYILHFFVKVFYDFNPVAFLKKNWFEGIMVLILILDGFSFTFFDTLMIESIFRSFGLMALADVSEFFIQFYLFAIVATELSQSGEFMPKIQLHPAFIFVLSFAIIILIGSGLLMLPEMSTGGVSYIDALFTSTSATCVTGLITLETATAWTSKGHIVLLILMKIGGINIILFGAFLTLLGRLGVGMKHHLVVEDFVNKESIFSSKGMLGRIVLISILVELIGSAIIFLMTTSTLTHLDFGEKVFFSLFHSVSAFNNAGFSTFSGGLYNEYLQNLYWFHITAGILIIVGSLGFTTLFDLFDPKKMKERRKQPWKKPYLGSQVSVITALVLIVGGAFFFFLFEIDNTLEGQSTPAAIIGAFFQSISLRTAGFNTVDLTQMSMPFIVICLVLMFIGGASSSTAGGIKTSTFSVVVLSAYSTIRGKKNIELFKKRIPEGVVFRSHSIFMFALSGIILGIFVLSITEAGLMESGQFRMMDLVYEEVSAFSTVGASTGVTPYLSFAGKVVVIVSMYIGRLGTLTVAYALSRNISSTNYKYPEESFMVG